MHIGEVDYNTKDSSLLVNVMLVKYIATDPCFLPMIKVVLKYSGWYFQLVFMHINFVCNFHIRRKLSQMTSILRKDATKIVNGTVSVLNFI